jgi:hypothetical protein
MVQPLSFATWLRLVAVTVLSAVLIGCAPAASPTSAPAPTSKPAAPAAAATTAPAAKPTEAPKPAAPAAPEAAKPDPAKMRAYFEGKTIELYIGYAAGGGYDIRGRIFAEFFPKYMPGNPKVAVVNLPGAGGLQATREVMRSRPDGLKMVIVPAGIYINELLGDDQEGFEVSQPLKLGNYEVVADDYTTLQVRSEIATTWDQIAAAGRSGKKFKYGRVAGRGRCADRGCVWLRRHQRGPGGTRSQRDRHVCHRWAGRDEAGVVYSYPARLSGMAESESEVRDADPEHADESARSVVWSLRLQGPTAHPGGG